MKYVVDYSFRSTGSHEQNLANGESLLRAFGKWKPEDGLKVHAFVSNLSDTGGYVLVETADPKVVFSFVSKFNTWVESNIVPVIDVGESVALGPASLAWAQSSSKG